MPTTILVVDDEVALRETVAEALEEADWTVYQAGTVADALRLQQDHHPDVVILDWLLPDGTGADFAREVATRDPAHRPPILLMTAMPSATKNAQSIPEPMDLITKPMRLRSLYYAVAHLIGIALPKVFWELPDGPDPSNSGLGPFIRQDTERGG